LYGSCLEIKEMKSIVEAVESYARELKKQRVVR
jgi:hypothetical protein